MTTEKADIRVELAGRWTKGMTVCNFESASGMRHFAGTAEEQTNFRHNVAMTLDHPEILRHDRRFAAVERRSPPASHCMC
jgi:purine nucleosidase